MDFIGMSGKSDDKAGMNRRTILKVIGVNAAAFGIGSGVAGAVEQSGLNVAEIDGGKRHRLVGKARRSEAFRLLHRELIVERGFSSSNHDVRVFHRNPDDGDSFYVVSFPLAHADEPTLKNADLTVVLEEDESFRTARGSAGFAVNDESVIAELHVFTIVNGSVVVESDQIHKSDTTSQDVTTQGDVYCEGCQELYGLACQYGCYIGWSSLCVLFTGGLGLIWCEGAVGALCDYIEENSCDQTSYVVCQIVGYC